MCRARRRRIGAALSLIAATRVSTRGAGNRLRRGLKGVMRQLIGAMRGRSRRLVAAPGRGRRVRRRDNREGLGRGHGRREDRSGGRAPVRPGGAAPARGRGVRAAAAGRQAAQLDRQPGRQSRDAGPHPAARSAGDLDHGGALPQGRLHQGRRRTHLGRRRDAAQPARRHRGPEPRAREGRRARPRGRRLVGSAALRRDAATPRRGR